jgi:hypothetical protein
VPWLVYLVPWLVYLDSTPPPRLSPRCFAQQHSWPTTEVAHFQQHLPPPFSFTAQTPALTPCTPPPRSPPPTPTPPPTPGSVPIQRGTASHLWMCMRKWLASRSTTQVLPMFLESTLPSPLRRLLLLIALHGISPEEVYGKVAHFLKSQLSVSLVLDISLGQALALRESAAEFVHRWVCGGRGARPGAARFNSPPDKHSEHGLGGCLLWAGSLIVMCVS